MTNSTPNEIIQKRQQAINDCITLYRLPSNNAIDEELLLYRYTPDSPSKKLAFLLLTYKREALTSELGQVSDQPAAQVRDLRNDGFVFQSSSPNRFVYKNGAGKFCRKIIGFGKPKEEIKQHAKSILQKSIAACVSAIEVYNKPDFQYREETFSILLVNAWELLLKAKILADNNDNFESILVFEKGVVKKNRTGNPFTVDMIYCLETLSHQKYLTHNAKTNLEMLVEIRDNSIHYINKALDFTKKVQEIGLASIKNYVTAIDEWFGKDLSEYNFFLMPMSFFHSLEASSFSVKSKDKELKNLLDYFKNMERSEVNEMEDDYNITLKLETKFVKASGDNVIKIHRISDENAPRVNIKVEEENIFRERYPWSYDELCERLEKRYVGFKKNNAFFKIKKDIEGQDGEHFCRTRYLAVGAKRGPSKTYYSTEIIKEFDKHYTKKT